MKNLFLSITLVLFGVTAFAQSPTLQSKEVERTNIQHENRLEIKKAEEAPQNKEVGKIPVSTQTVTVERKAEATEAAPATSPQVAPETPAAEPQTAPQSKKAGKACCASSKAKGKSCCASKGAPQN